MRPVCRCPVSLAAACLPRLGAHAGEGMWVPQQLPEISGPLKKAGLKLPAKQLADLTGDPMGAVVALGGCTASFVSPQGLVVTNHHCAYGAIQLNSTAERNLIKTASTPRPWPTRSAPAPMRGCTCSTDIREVTDRGQGGHRRGRPMPLAAPGRWRRSRSAWSPNARPKPATAAACTASPAATPTGCSATWRSRTCAWPMHPRAASASYGGDIDNWMWPRHTGDFAFYRAYVGADGKPAAYSPEDNVPYRPSAG
jgi:hypothetical protein